MKRKIMDDLLEWKQKKYQKCLIIVGARQVGKTYIIKEFGNTYYENMIHINFEYNLDAKKVFEGNLDYKNLMLYLSAANIGIDIKPEKTLIFFDEIQACPRAIVALKLFAEMNDYDVIASGSLLGVSLKNVSSYPVGYVDQMTLYPLDFEEFLWANGVKEEHVEYLKNCFMSGEMVIESIHNQYYELFLKYIVVGGMPDAVKTLINTNSMFEVKKVHDSILTAYRNDMAKYATNDVKVKVLSCFESIPNQLAKDNKKFQYKLLMKGGSARHFEGSIEWIVNSGLVYKVHRLDHIEEVLKLGKSLSTFKLYFFDTGLLLSMYGENVADKILNNDLGVFKGAIYENIIAQILITNKHDVYYYESGPSLEIDFVVKLANFVVPIEVKSSDNTKAKSLKSFINKFNIEKAIKLSKNNVNCTNETIKAYPLYMALFI